MFWQWLVVLTCVLLAAAYIARAAWRTWHPKAGGCGGGCGCAKPADAPKVTLIPADELTVRRRTS
jgi:FeoB-associated Cys-rich membrane protein